MNFFFPSDNFITKSLPLLFGRLATPSVIMHYKIL